MVLGVNEDWDNPVDLCAERRMVVGNTGLRKGEWDWESRSSTYLIKLILL